MRIRSRITFREDDVAKAEDILRPFRFRASRNTFIHLVTVFVDDERYDELVKELRTRNIDYHVEQEKVFDQGELRASDYLLLMMDTHWGYPQPEDDFGYRNVSFDVSKACPLCGNGAIQLNPLMIKGKVGFGKRDITAMFWISELIVNTRLRSLIESSDLTGAEFWPLLRYKLGQPGEPIVGYYQLLVKSVLHPASSSTIFPVVTLPRGIPSCSCGRTGRNWPRNQLRYKRNDLTAAKDFNMTYEWLGGGLGTSQLKVVSSRVYEMFIKNKVKGAVFEPVIVED